MTYAYDRAIPLPVKDLYDKQIMAMSIDAARDMYKEGQKQINDFYEKYGDFTSPIQKDMDWYAQNVTGKASDFINQLYANGVDPLRSAEGRAAVAQLVRSMPIGDIAKVRQSADNARAFLKAKLTLQEKGLYNPLLDKYEGVGLDQYSTLGDGENSGMGVWSRMSPTPYQNMAAFSKDYFDNLKPFTRSASKNGVSYTKSEITEADLHNIADEHFNDLVNTPQGQLMYKMYLDQTGGDKAAARQAFNNAVVSGNKDRLFYNDDYNENLLKVQQLQLARAKLALARQVAEGKQNKEEAPTTFMDRLQNNMQKNFENKAFGAGSVGNTTASFADYWDKMMTSVENKGRVVGHKEETTTKNVKIPGFGATPFGDFHAVGPNTGKATEKTTKPVYDQSQNALYKKYSYEKQRWLKFGQTGEYAPSIYDKSKEAAEVRRIIKLSHKDPKSITVQDVAKVQAYMENDIKQMQYKVTSNSPGYLGKGNQPRGTTTTADLKRRSGLYWDQFRAEGLQDIPNKVLTEAFTGTALRTIDPDLPDKQATVTFGSGYEYAPIRQSKVAGSGRFKYNDIHSKFNRWLKSDGRSGIVFDENKVVAAGIPQKNRTGIQLDVMQYPAITKEQFMEFYNNAGGSRLGTPENVAKKLGLRPTSKKLKYKDKNEILHETDTYYEVPVIRTIDNLGGYNFRDINTTSDRYEFGQGTADKNVIDSENQSVLQGLLLD